MYTDEDRQSALTRALITAGAAMTQPGRGGLMGALGRGGMMGMQAYDQTYDDIAKRRIQEEQQRQLALKAKLEEIGLTRQEALAKIFSQFSGDAASGAASAQSAPRPSIVDAPGWAGSSANAYSPNAAPSIRPQQQDAGGRQEALIRALSLGGFQNEAKGQLEVFKGLEGEVYGDPQVDRNGRTFVNTKRGPRYIEGGGFVPRDKLVETDVGDRKVFRTEYDLTPRGEYRKGMSPDAAAANALGWANYYKPELRDSGTGVVAVSPDGKGGVRSVPTDIARKQERLPSGDAEKILSLDEIVAKSQWAKEGVQKNPGAVGPENALLPSWMLNMGPASNIDTRARLAELATAIGNARSGAAISKEEYRRLEPFLPSENDSPKTAQTKLNSLAKTMNEIQRGRRSFYASQGYNVPGPQFGQGSAAELSMPDLAKAIEAELARRAGKGR